MSSRMIPGLSLTYINFLFKQFGYFVNSAGGAKTMGKNIVYAYAVHAQFPGYFRYSKASPEAQVAEITEVFFGYSVA